jgi:hypothetical protein
MNLLRCRAIVVCENYRNRRSQSKAPRRKAVPMKPSRKRWRAASLAAGAALVLGGCGGTGGGADGGSGSGKSESLVWVDNTRMPAAQQYEKAHPDLKMRIVTIPPDAGYVPTKARQPHRERLARRRLPGQPGRGCHAREREVRLRGPARRPRPEVRPRRLHLRLPQHLHVRRQGVLPARRHRPHRRHQAAEKG